FAWADPRGAFSTAPYLRLIAVNPIARSAGVGSALLAEFEERTAEEGRDFFLLVSEFNKKAISFYERHGYRKTGRLEDFAKKGITEIMMVKKREKIHE
ncbi:MAG TPA: N-acetyltransferase, partial [Sediminispirochaeta sp.]|nr:N-acetyltransferase [Sediminispirochaeta sp.]